MTKALTFTVFIEQPHSARPDQTFHSTLSSARQYLAAQLPKCIRGTVWRLVETKEMVLEHGVIG